jgi:hypothetical protein
MSGKLGQVATEKAMLTTHDFERMLQHPLWKGKQKFLLDTGSAVSLLKQSVLQNPLAVTKPSIELHGVNCDILELQGQITDVFEGKPITWYIVNFLSENLGGIIGRDYFCQTLEVTTKVLPLREQIIKGMVNKPNGEYFIPTQKLVTLLIGQGIIKVEYKQCTSLAINLTDERVESHGYL